MPTIQLKQWPSRLRTKRGSILDAALAAGVPYPHSCRSGDCGACKSRLSAGEVLMDGYDPEVLSEADRKAGLILACRAHPRTDVVVEWLQPGVADAAPPVQQASAKVVKLEAATHDIVRLVLEVQGEPLAFLPGQYAELRFEGCPARPYSMANRPGESRLEFHVRRVPEGVVSGYVARHLREGDRVHVNGPFGTAFLRQPAEEPMLLVAGGSGLAPMKSILLAALAQQARCPMHLYHGVRDARDLYDGQALADAGGGKVRYVPVLSAASAKTAHRQGFVHEALAQDFASLAGFKVYLAGPPPMVDAATAAARARGVDGNDVHADPFFAAPRQSAEARPARKGLLGRLFS